MEKVSYLRGTNRNSMKKRDKMKLVKSWAELLSRQMTKEQLLLLWHFRNDYFPEMTAAAKEALMQ